MRNKKQHYPDCESKIGRKCDCNGNYLATEQVGINWKNEAKRIIATENLLLWNFLLAKFKKNKKKGFQNEK